jgi:proteasome beta subunit
MHMIDDAPYWPVAQFDRSHQSRRGDANEEPDRSGNSVSWAKSGTTTVGLTTTDGVVLASDMRASLEGQFVLNKDLQKVLQIHPTGALTLVGLIGHAQAFIRTMQSRANLYEVRHGSPMSITAIQATARQILREQELDNINPIVGGVDEDGHHVASIDPAGGVLDDTYTATGSGQAIATGVLESSYEPEITNDVAVDIASRAIQAANNRDTASGNGLVVARINASGVDITTFEDPKSVVT